MSDFISGAIVTADLIAGLFFLRFWKRAKDALFAYFAAAFWILGAQRMAMWLMGTEAEDHILAYLVRLSAFVVILLAIWNKNRPTKGE